MQCYKNNFYAAKTSTFQIVKNVQISKNRVYYKIRIYNSGIINTYIKKKHDFNDNVGQLWLQ